MTASLRTVRVAPGESALDFDQAKRLADAVASVLLDDAVCLSWYDRAAERESPAHASECHENCETPGYVEYAITRGAELKVVVDEDDYVFCYRPLGEFAGE
jgi:hypothetical protein